MTKKENTLRVPAVEAGQAPQAAGQAQGDKQNKVAKKYEWPLRQKGGIYFHCGAIISRKNVFVTKEYMDLLVNAIKLAELKRDVKNLAYVIMPNYFYWLFKLPQNQEDPVAIYSEVKKNVAGEIMNNLKLEIKNGSYQMLDLFKNNSRVGRSKPERLLWTFEEQAKNFKDNKRYKIWAPKTGLRLIDNDECLQKKLNSIKNAAVSERWQLAGRSEDYPYLFVADEMPEKEVYDCLKSFSTVIASPQLAALAS
ncbi:MAG: hypothetical protein AAB766_02175 [Patescibacteria group bacterium]